MTSVTSKKQRRAPLWLKLILGGLGVIILLLAFGAFLMYPALRRAPSETFAQPKDQAEAYRQDVRQLRLLLTVDRSFSPATRSAFTGELDALDRDAAGLDRAAFEMRAAHAVALARNGHTNLRGVSWGIDLNAVPLRMTWFKEGLFVVAADPAHADLLGLRVVSLNGRTPDDLARALRPYVGGPPSLSRELTPHLLASPQALHAIGLGDTATAISLGLAGPGGGGVVEHEVQALDTPSNGKPDPKVLRDVREGWWPKRDYSPVRWPGDERRWVHMLDKGPPLPTYLSHPNDNYWSTRLSEPDAIYVQINQTQNAPSGPNLKAFLKGVIKDAAARPPRNAIVDLRFNPGGNYALTAAFTEALPKTLGPGGKVFILTSGNTFSAGLITAARLKFFAGAQGYVVGERIGDDERFWAEGSRIKLPNTGLSIGYATGYHDWMEGCSITLIMSCYPTNYIFGRPAGPMSPAIPAPISMTDYLAGRDSAMRAISARLAAP